jgi:hypothetical protein
LKVPVDLIRDVLYNIEQFRDDAFILPDINVKAVRPEKKTGFTISNRTKSSGVTTRSSNTNKSGFGSNSTNNFK